MSGPEKSPARRFARRADAGLRLRPLELAADEVALEVRGKHAGGAGRARLARRPDAAEHLAQRRGRAGDGRRAECRHAEWRQPRRDPRDGVGAVQRVGALDAVHVDVDEARDDEVALEIAAVARTARLRPR